MKTDNEYARLARQKDITARTSSELIAACFGTNEEKSKHLAEQIDAQTFLERLGNLRLPKAKAVDLYSLFDEIKRRQNLESIVKEGLPVIRTTNDITQYVTEIRSKKKEYLLAFFLNARNQLIAKEIISIGTLTASLAHPREIFAPAIGKAAASVILAHNHPSGDPSPSNEDMRLTQRIAQVGRIMGIELVDHLVIAETGCYSFKQAGAL